ARAERAGTNTNVDRNGGKSAIVSERKDGGAPAKSISDANTAGSSVAQTGSSGPGNPAETDVPDPASGRALPSRNTSYTSVANAGSSPSISTVSGQANQTASSSNQNQTPSAGMGSVQSKGESKAESRQTLREHVANLGPS
ncbi:hypothetical protein EV177_010921, partial [Coemansia sp. RSA 1804]